MCLNPRLLLNPKYLPNKKNGGKPPPLSDPRVKYVPIGCNNCIECSKQKANNWKTRLMEDIKTNKDAIFVTLTFSNKSFKKLAAETEAKGYALDNYIATRATRLFLENWRKKHKKSLRHWLITELGHKGTENVHLHGIVWTKDRKAIEANWKHGYVFLGTFVNEKTINYITKYVTKKDIDHKLYKPIILTSPGIGANYTKTTPAKENKFKEEGETKEYYKTRQGIKAGLPIYWRNKIYTDEEREKLWIKKLEKNERYVLGKKCKTMEEYWKALQTARQKNLELGYEKETWALREYEEQLRKLKHEERINGSADLNRYAEPENEEGKEKKNNNKKKKKGK